LTARDVSALLQALRGKDKHEADQAAARLQALGVRAIPALVGALGSRNGLAALTDPIIRLWEKPRPLDADAPQSEWKRRIEDILFALGPSALPWLAEEFDHPDRDVRRAIARVLARHGAAAIAPLLGALQGPRTRWAAGDALAAIGSPALEPLTFLLRSEPPRSRIWAAADAVLCAITRAPTRHEIVKRREQIVTAWIAFAAVGALFAAIGLLAGIEWWIALFFGLIVGYLAWVIVIRDSNLALWEGWDGCLFLVLDVFTAPFTYRKKAARYRGQVAAREQLMNDYGLPQ
jgi:HEAT repeat protein